MNMFVFEEVAARQLTPEQAAERLVRERYPEPKRRGWAYRVALAIVGVVLGTLIPSLAERRS